MSFFYRQGTQCKLCNDFVPNEYDEKKPGWCKRWKEERNPNWDEKYKNGEPGFTSKHCCTYFISTIVYDLKIANCVCESEAQNLRLEMANIYILQEQYLSKKYPGIWSQYGYLGYLIAQYIKGLPSERAIAVANIIHKYYFEDILYNKEYSIDDKCHKYIEMFEDMKSYFGINAAMEGSLYDDNALPIPVDPSRFLQNCEQQPETTIVGISPMLILEPLNK